jgi:hypothetical protein
MALFSLSIRFVVLTVANTDQPRYTTLIAVSTPSVAQTAVQKAERGEPTTEFARSGNKLRR